MRLEKLGQLRRVAAAEVPDSESAVRAAPKRRRAQTRGVRAHLVLDDAGADDALHVVSANLHLAHAADVEGDASCATAHGRKAKDQSPRRSAAHVGARKRGLGWDAPRYGMQPPSRPVPVVNQEWKSGPAANEISCARRSGV